MKKGIKRGVSVYSYSNLINCCMTLEDCFRDIADTGSTCIEILAGHVENYPNPSPAWVEHWYQLLEKYHLEPGEYGHWCNTRLYPSRLLNADEAVEELLRDFKVANLLGFRTLRTKITTNNHNNDPEPGWQEYVKRSLDLAEKYDVRMCSEVHTPTTLRTQHIDEYIEFIEKTKTKYFGFNVDFSTFMNALPEEARVEEYFWQKVEDEYSYPEDLLKVLPYTYVCHAKLNYMNENFEEITIPYPEIMKILMDNNWSGYLLSEYEGPHKGDYAFVGDQLRRHHVMLKRILGY